MPSLKKCFLFTPSKTGIVLITVFGLLNKLSGFYGLISLDYSDSVAVCSHVYSLFALVLFSLGFYGLIKDNYHWIYGYTVFYWIDFFVSSIAILYFAVRWFVYTDHQLAEYKDDPEAQQQQEASFYAESIVSMVFLCLFKLIHLSFAFAVTRYYISIGKVHYTKLRASVDKELNMDTQ